MKLEDALEALGERRDRAVDGLLELLAGEVIVRQLSAGVGELGDGAALVVAVEAADEAGGGGREPLPVGVERDPELGGDLVRAGSAAEPGVQRALRTRDPV